MRHIEWVLIVTLSFTLLLANSFICIAQDNADKQDIAVEYALKGVTAYSKGNYREAIINYTVAIALAPNERFYFYRGEAKFELKDFQGAINDYSNSILLTTNSPRWDAYKRRGDAKLEIKDYKGAIADYDEYFSYIPDKAVDAAIGAIAPEAKRDADKRRANTYYSRGIAKDNLGDKAGACSDFRKSCNLGNSDSCKHSDSSVCINPLTTNAQSNVTSLSGTEWAWVLPIDGGTSTVQYFYKFEDGQKVIRRVVAIVGDRLQHGIDNNMLLFYGTNTLTMNHLPSVVGVVERTGKYTQDGDSLTMEFSDSVVRLTYDKDKGLWSGKTEPAMYRISPSKVH